MPRIVRIRFHVEPIPDGSLSTHYWLTLLTRNELIRLHEWCEPWPLLWTLSDWEAVHYVRRYHHVGPAAFMEPRERPFWMFPEKNSEKMVATVAGHD